MRTWLAYALLATTAPRAAGMTAARRAELRDETKSMFEHGYTSYLTYAYPADELRPLSCAPLVRDAKNAANVGINDIHANASITLVDSLSAIPLIMPEAYPDALERVATQVSFDQDAKVQVFEMTIRALGALLSTHQRLSALPDAPAAQAAALGISKPVDVKRYAGRMLELALDLGTRLLPAFSSPTGLPYARVNLRHGMDRTESVETCTAGAGSLVLEFTLLSRLTGDTRFESLAHRSFMYLWNKRSPNDLVGNGIAVSHGHWLGPGLSGVNAGIDSFFEYALKAGILLDDSTYMDIFYDAFSAIQTHVRTDDGFIYRPVHLRGLNPPSPSYIDSLSSFFPGVMVLAGDLESAIRGHLVFWNIWRRYRAIPEAWQPENRQIGWGGWPGRPEFIESTYYLHRATGDDFYLRVGEQVLHDIKERSMTPCGFATLSNVQTGELDDRMESFMLSETLKYLYLLFDDQPAPISNTVFTTEGHPLSLPRNLTRTPSATWREMHKGEDLFCPAYVPPTLGGVRVGIEGRDDYDYARALVFGPDEAGLGVESAHAKRLWGDGVCAVPSTPRFSFELILAPAEAEPDAPTAPHDPSPSAAKVFQDKQGDWVISDIDGLRLGVRWRFDGTGYDVTNIGPHRVRQGQHVTITDGRMDGYLPVAPKTVSDIAVQFARAGDSQPLLTAQAATATFGGLFESEPYENPQAVLGPERVASTRWTLGTPLPVVRVTGANGSACSPITAAKLSPLPDGGAFVLLAPRGGCTFAAKAIHAANVGAAGVLVADDQPAADGHPNLLRPSADDEDTGPADHTGVLFIDYATGKLVQRMLDVAHVTATPVPMDPAAPRFPASARREGRMVVGDHDIVNMRVVET